MSVLESVVKLVIPCLEAVAATAEMAVLMLEAVAATAVTGEMENKETTLEPEAAEDTSVTAVITLEAAAGCLLTEEMEMVMALEVVLASKTVLVEAEHQIETWSVVLAVTVAYISFISGRTDTMRYKIFKDGERVNTIVADESFVTDYCEKNGYACEADLLPEPEPEEPAPTPEDRIATLEEENHLLSQQVTALTDQNDFQEELIVELANIVYA